MPGNITPAGSELLRAIQTEINAQGEARCVKRIVEAACTMPVNYAYVLLKNNAHQWGLAPERVKRRLGGFEIIIREKNNEKC